MSFIFMVFHYPLPTRRDTLAKSMGGLREFLLSQRGCIAVEPPYLTEDGRCLVGISKWESRDAFEELGITMGPPGEVIEGETRPRERFFMEAVDPPLS